MRVLTSALIPLLPTVFLACTHPAPTGSISGERVSKSPPAVIDEEALQAHIRLLIGKLRSGNNKEREKAAELLREHMEVAVPELTRASKGEQADLSKVAAEILGAIARERFRQMRRSIQDAKSLKIVFSARISKGIGAGIQTEGTILFREDEKINMHVKIRHGGKEGWYRFVSDGIRAYTSNDRSPDPHIGRASEAEVRRRKHALFFFGYQKYAGGLQPLTSKNVAEMEGIWTECRLSVEKVSQNTFCLRYSFPFPDILHMPGTITGHVGVWYDVKSGNILKHKFRYGSDGGEIPLTESSETYECFELDGHIPDEKFLIPTD